MTKLSKAITVIPLFFYLLLHTLCSIANEKVTVSGYVKDKSTGEELIGATVFIKRNTQKGISTNTYGYYALSLEPGQYTLVARYLGYQRTTINLNLEKDTTINFKLEEKPIATETVEIKAEKEDDALKNTQMSKLNIPMKKLNTIPVLFGEPDPLKTLKLMPGVQGGGEGNTGLNVRGGGSDQNLILLDEAVVYNPGHLFGFFSIFHADAIKDAKLIKGGMPARYGGRISSVLDFSMKEGNNKKYTGKGGIGLISSGITLEGPIVKDTSSFLISARRTYIDALSQPVLQFTSGLFPNQNDYDKVPYYFYDLNAKFNYRFSDKDRIFFSTYLGKDDLSFRLLEGRINANFEWGNRTATFRWNHVFSQQLFMNLSAIYNTFNFNAGTVYDNFSTNLSSHIRDYSLKSDFEYYTSVKNHVRFGAHYTFHDITPRQTIAQTEDNVNFSGELRNKEKYAHDLALYISDKWEPFTKLKIQAGLRYSLFQQVGPYDYINSRSGDTTRYDDFESVQQYQGFEPRFSGRYLFNEKSSFKASYTINYQYLHMISLSGNSLPFDVWVPSSKLVRPQKGTQYALGYFRNFKDNTYEASIETYYKDMRNQIAYSDEYVPKITAEIERDFVSGRGWAYGAELFLKKKTGKFQGWLSYAWSRAFRKFDAINDGNPYPARFDRIHDISLVLTYKLNPKWEFGTNFVYTTGRPITMAQNRYLIEGLVTSQYGQRNDFRMAPYHRWDISARYTPDPDKEKDGKYNFKSSWTFALYNVYSRKNPFIYYPISEGDPLNGTLKVQAKKLFIFPVLPSVKWNFEF